MRSSTDRLSRSPWTLVALTVGLACLAGCVGKYHGHPERRGERSAAIQAAPVEALDPVEWRQIYSGSPPKPTLEGYLRTEGVRDGYLRAGSHWVYSPRFELVGRISAKGRTVRVHRGGRETDEGNYALEIALLKLFGHPRGTEISLVRMPPPRG